MEAGGIEPPSRDGSEKVSTCIVVSFLRSIPDRRNDSGKFLNLAATAADRQASV